MNVTEIYQRGNSDTYLVAGDDGWGYMLLESTGEESPPILVASVLATGYWEPVDRLVAAIYVEAEHPRNPRGSGAASGRWREKTEGLPPVSGAWSSMEGTDRLIAAKQLVRARASAYWDESGFVEFPGRASTGPEAEASRAKILAAHQIAEMLKGDPDWEKTVEFMTTPRARSGDSQADLDRHYDEMYPWAQSKDEVAASILIGTWAMTSSDSNQQANLMQIAVEDEFGLEGTSQYPRANYGFSPEGDPRYAGFRKFARAQYDITQEVLATSGLTSVPMFRGVRAGATGTSHDYYRAMGLPEPGQVRERVALNPISSWAYDTETAALFATGGSTYRAVFAATIPRERILGMPGTGFGCLDENETVVLGGLDDVFSYAETMEEGGSYATPSHALGDEVYSAWSNQPEFP